MTTAWPSGLELVMTCLHTLVDVACLGSVIWDSLFKGLLWVMGMVGPDHGVVLCIYRDSALSIRRVII